MLQVCPEDYRGNRTNRPVLPSPPQCCPDLPAQEQEERRQEIAEDHGLKVVNGKIPLPDVRIEYENRDDEQARVDLELVTSDYRGNQLAEKAQAGFSIYAPADEAGRVRAALKDPHLMTEILSL